MNDFKPKSRFLFIGGNDGILKQVDIEKKALVKDYGEVANAVIKSMATSNNTKYLFTSDMTGHLQIWEISVLGDTSKWDVEHRLVLKYQQKMHENAIGSITITPNSKYLFTSDYNGTLAQWAIQDAKISINFYQKIHNGEVYSIATTSDSKYLFTSSYNGYIKQWFIFGECSFIKEFARVCFGILIIVLSQDNKYLFLGTQSGYLKQLDIKKKSVSDLGKIAHNPIHAMLTSRDTKFLFVNEKFGDITQWNIKRRYIVKNIKYILGPGVYITAMENTNDGRYLFIGDSKGELKQWDVFGQTLVKEFKGLNLDSITSLKLT